MSVILNRDAAISGQYVKAFLFNNELICDGDITEQNVTPSHYLVIPDVEYANQNKLENDIFKRLIVLKTYTFMGQVVNLRRDPLHSTYIPNDYEKGVELFLNNNIDLAYKFFYSFYKKHPSQPDNLIVDLSIKK